MTIVKVLTFLMALHFAAPLFSEEEDEMSRILLADTKEKILKLFGPPKAAVEFGEDFQSWQYQIGEGDHDDFTHQVVFRKSTGDLVSFTRNYESPRKVLAFFPVAESKAFAFIEAGKAAYPMLLRTLPDGRLLFASGISKPQQTTTQLVVMRQSELRYFYPWLEKQLTENREPASTIPVARSR